jgi:cytosine/adenosine deaminase-related metal-dependent hydrolase
VAEAARNQGWPVHTHALEQEEETELVRHTRSGRDEIQYFDDLGLLDLDLRLAHGVWLNEQHRKRIAGGQVSIIHCPSANLKLGSGIADLKGLADAEIATGLGSDGPPCSNDLDGWKEIRLAALLQKLRHGPETLSGHEALALATRNGARAIGLKDAIGCLEPGMAGDLVILDMSRPELWGADGVDLHDLLVFGGSRAHVKHVAVAGQVLVQDGQLQHLDLGEIRQRATQAIDRVLKTARI